MLKIDTIRLAKEGNAIELTLDKILSMSAKEFVAKYHDDKATFASEIPVGNRIYFISNIYITKDPSVGHRVTMYLNEKRLVYKMGHKGNRIEITLED